MRIQQPRPPLHVRGNDRLYHQQLHPYAATWPGVRWNRESNGRECAYHRNYAFTCHEVLRGTAHQRTRPQLVHGNIVIQTARLSCLAFYPAADRHRSGTPPDKAIQPFSTNETRGEAKVEPKEATTSYRARRGLLGKLDDQCVFGHHSLR